MKKLTILSIFCLFSLQCEKGWLREIVNPTVEGCNIPTACNYNPDVNKFDNSCEYASCIDCLGMLNGVATIDSCGTCDAVTLNNCEKDCAGVWGGGKLWDCDSICNGTNMVDNCNVCDADPSNDCDADCEGVWGGSAVKDECDICGGGGLCDCGDGNSSCECCCSDGQVRDCSGECGGFAVLDECNVCGGSNSCFDCAGVPNGDAVEDSCGVCIITYSAYEHTAYMTAIVKLGNDEQLGGTGDMLVSIDEAGNIRGQAVQILVPFGPYEGAIMYEITIHSNNFDDIISFKYFDVSENKIYNIQDNYTFVINDILGNLIEPHEIDLGSSHENISEWDAIFSSDCIQDCEGVWGGTAVIDNCGICDGGGGCYSLDCTDNPSLYCQDLSILQEIIDNSSETININMDDNGNGIIEPLELGIQKWEYGRLVEFDCFSTEDGMIRLPYFDPNLGECHLSNGIPKSIGNLTKLTHLNFRSNQLSGTIPREIGNLTDITYLNFSWNQLIEGIPAEIGNLSNLTYLSLSHNQLTSEIPIEICYLINLTGLNLSSNQLTGELPSYIGNLVNIAGLHLNDNQLSGEIPSTLCEIPTYPFGFTLYNNNFCWPYPECVGSLLLDVIQDTLYCP